VSSQLVIDVVAQTAVIICKGQAVAVGTDIVIKTTLRNLMFIGPCIIVLVEE